MQGVIRYTRQRPGSFTVDAVEAMRALEAMGREPVVLGYHPVARMNPFQGLLYAEAWDAGLAPIAMLELARLDELESLARLGFRTALHLHWLGGPLEGATSAADAERRRAAFVGRLDAYLAAGGRIAWTVHNILSHGARFERSDAGLHGDVASRATVVHVLAERSRELVAPLYDIPADRILHVPHPSYRGAYEDYVGRNQARHELGLMPDELVYVLLGALRAYKGLAELLDAWDALPPGSPRRLVIAGEPEEGPGVAELIERAALGPDVVVHPRRVPPNHVQRFLRAADVVVVPYVRSLNSGALFLALTFGVPVIVPAGGALADAVDDRFAVTYAGGTPGALADALVRAADLVTPAAREAAREAADARDPVVLSRLFARGLRERLGD